MNVPKDLKPYLARARELEGAFPLVSYYCRLYVVDSLMRHGAEGLDPADERV